MLHEKKTDQIFLETFQKNPVLFFKEVLGVDSLEPYHEDILDAVAKYQRVDVSACHDVGKSWISARIAIWFLSCFPFSKVITTAPTFNQVQNILWGEIRTAHANSRRRLGGRMNLTNWHLSPNGDWFGIGFSPRREAIGESGQGTQSSFQGFHSEDILIIFDEATGIPPQIYDMAEGMLTSANAKFLKIANPTSRSSRFYKSFRSVETKSLKLNCFNSPNLIANGITDLEKLVKEIQAIRELPIEEAKERMTSYKVVRPYLLVTNWVVGRALEWGIDHPLFQSKVLGEFPTTQENSIASLDMVEQAQLRVVWPDANDQKVLGIDVARFGTDSTVFTGLHGKKQIGKKELVKRDTTEICGAALNEINTFGYQVVVIDETGIGGGLVDLLSEAKREGRIPKYVEIRGVQFGGGLECKRENCKHLDCEKGKYVNLKAKMYGLLSDDIKKNLQLLDGLDGEIYLDELPTILYSYDSKGRMVIESKDEYKRRTGRKSPDFSDSLALANYGRYGSSTVGKFVGTKTDDDFPKPFASSIHSERKW